jgi:hypothetical protein
MRRFALLAPALLLHAAPALAQDAPRVAPAANPFPGAHACMCRAFGEAYEVGERVCLGRGAQARIAECTIDVNVMSWRFTAEPCPPS